MNLLPGFATIIEAIGNVFYEKNLDEQNVYTLTNDGRWSSMSDELIAAQHHPILTLQCCS